MKNNGTGLIEFKNENDASKASKMDLRYKEKLLPLKLFYGNSNKKEEPVEKTSFPIKDEEIIVEEIIDTGRLYLRNLSFEVTENHIVDLFKQYGDLLEVSVPYDYINKRPKGFAYVTFMLPKDAVKAYNALNQTKLINRKMHILPSAEKPDSDNPDKVINDNDDNVKKRFQEERLEQLKSTSNSAHNWNMLFVNSDAVAQYLANKLKITKSELFNDSLKGSMSVKLAIAETELVSTIKNFLEENNIQIDELNKLTNRGPRSKTLVNVSFALSSTTFIVKNLTPEVNKDDLLTIFNKFDGLDHILLPPYGATAIVTYKLSQQAKVAYNTCAYMPMNNNVLMLQWAPNNIFKLKDESSIIEKTNENAKKLKRSRENDSESEVKHNDEKSKKLKVSEVEKDVKSELRSTRLILKNLSFQATKKELYELFGKFEGLKAIRLTKKNAEDHRGFAFLEFESEDQAEAVKEIMGDSTHLLGRRMILEYSQAV